jgi:hypothetical protein
LPQLISDSGWRGIELGPVELLLNTVEGFFADLAPRAQAVQCRALRLLSGAVRGAPAAAGRPTRGARRVFSYLATVP